MGQACYLEQRDNAGQMQIKAKDPVAPNDKQVIYQIHLGTPPTLFYDGAIAWTDVTVGDTFKCGIYETPPVPEEDEIPSSYDFTVS